jgi:hypothetical protein
MKPFPNGGNDKKITFEETAPDWSKRLDRLMIAKVLPMKKILYTLT